MRSTIQLRFTSQLAHRLIQLGAPSKLVHWALAVVRDALDWLLELPGAADRRLEIQGMLPELRMNYGGDPDALPSARAHPQALRVWGLMPRSEYREAVELCVRRDLVPRLTLRSFEMRAALECNRSPIADARDA